MRKCILLLLTLLMTIPVIAQVGSEDDVEMIPFFSAPLNIQGLRPSTWRPQENAEGVFIQAADPFDLTAIIMQAQDADKATFLASVATSFQLDSEFDVLETIDSNFFTWEIFQFERTQGEQELIVDMAVAEDAEAGRVYFVLFQSNAIFYDNLHEKVFLPAVEWLSPIQFYEDPEDRFVVPIPVQWHLTEIGNYGQLTNLDDSIAIFVMALENDDSVAAVQEFLNIVNPDFDTTFDAETNNLRVLDDPARIGGLEAVYIIDWVNSAEAEGRVLQSVARVYDGVVYMTIIVTTLEVAEVYEMDIAFIDNGFAITALVSNSEATAEAEE